MKTSDVPSPPTFEGFAHAPFECVVEPFRRLLGQVGGNAALTVFHRGECVVDLGSTLFGTHGRLLTFSVSKAVAAIAIAVAEEEGLLDVAAPISECWPEFSRASTQAITLRDVLTHRSGLAAVTAPVTLDDLLSGRIEHHLTRQDPLWAPGTMHGYHAVTFGWLVDGVLQRAAGLDLATLVSTRLSNPLGLNLTLGVPRDEQSSIWQLRIGEQGAAASTTPPPILAAGGACCALGVVADRAVWNCPAVVEQPWGSSNVVAGSHDLAKLFASALGPVEGMQVLSADGLERLTAEQSNGLDQLLGIHTAFGRGVQLPFPNFPMLGPGSFGHEGANGSAVVVQPRADLSVAFVTDKFPKLDGVAPEFMALLPAIRQCL